MFRRVSLRFPRPSASRPPKERATGHRAILDLPRGGALLLLLLPVAFLGACSSHPVPGAYQKEIRAQGFTAYSRPSGDPRNPRDWDKFGPGTVLRSRQQTYYEPARTIIGADGVQEAMKPENASPISLFSGKRVSGYDFDGQGGWTLDAVNQIAAAVNFKSATTVDLQFGRSWLANSMSEGALHRAVRAALPRLDDTTRRALRRGDFAIVENAVFTDSVRYTFRQAQEGGASATYKLSAQDIAALQAKGYRVIDGGVEVTQPTFIAFTPLPDVAGDIPRK